jgi:hypothetical protein
MVTMGILPYQGKFTMVGPEIEPGTSLLVVRNPNHLTTRLLPWLTFSKYIPCYFAYLAGLGIRTALIEIFC